MGSDNSFNAQTQVLKNALGVIIGGQRGEYIGEMLIDSEIAHGRGFFISDDKKISCRYFKNGEFAEGSSLELNLITG